MCAASSVLAEYIQLSGGGGHVGSAGGDIELDLGNIDMDREDMQAIFSIWRLPSRVELVADRVKLERLGRIARGWQMDSVVACIADRYAQWPTSTIDDWFHAFDTLSHWQSPSNLFHHLCTHAPAAINGQAIRAALADHPGWLQRMSYWKKEAIEAFLSPLLRS
jgi:hypothetical protein